MDAERQPGPIGARQRAIGARMKTMDRYDELEEVVLSYEATLEATVRAILDKLHVSSDKLLRSATDSAVNAITSELYDSEC
jgi:hypothetical protein